MNPHDNTTYIIVPFVDMIQQMIDDCAETSIDTLRHSISGVDRVVLKWVGSTPASVSAYTQYTHTEILTVMAGVEWSGEGEAASSSSSSM